MERKDEIGRLAVSFARMQRSVRDKLALIREQNKELENSLALIQQKNQELELADKLKDDFLATTSHELRTPLHGMIGIAESLIAGANGPVPQAQQHQLQMLVNSGQRLSNLVDDLLDYHKMRYGDLEIELRQLMPAQPSVWCLNSQRTSSATNPCVSSTRCRLTCHLLKRMNSA